MDHPDVDRAALRRALRFLTNTNRRFGGHRAVLRQLDAWTVDWPAERELRVLDVGTGAADTPVAVWRWAEARKRPVRIVGVDFHPVTLELAAENVPDGAPIELVEADALTIGERYEAETFDVAHAGLFLHHLSDVQVLTVLAAMHRVSRVGVIWNDLLRSAWSRVIVRVMSVPGGPIVRHDAAVSIDAGFTVGEARDLARRVELPNVGVRTVLGYRFVLTSTK